MPPKKNKHQSRKELPLWCFLCYNIIGKKHQTIIIYFWFRFLYSTERRDYIGIDFIFEDACISGCCGAYSSDFLWS